MKIILISLRVCSAILFFLVIFSCNKDTVARKTQYSDSQILDIISADSLSTSKDTVLFVNENLKYRFQVNSNGPEIWSNIVMINYADVENVSLSKSIDLNDKGEAVFLKFDDYNFDGYLDMYIHNTCAILNNCSGYIYLFDPELKEFNHDKQFDSLTTITVDIKKQEIYSTSRSQAGAYFERGIYKMNKGTMKIFRLVTQRQDDSGWIFQITEFDLSGKPRIIKREVNKYPAYSEDGVKY